MQAVEEAVRAGIVVVASAGNYGTNSATGQMGYAGISSPGNAPSAITVGAIDTKLTATRQDDTIPMYSSRGPSWYDGLAKPDIVAPGHRLVSNATPDSFLARERPSARVAGKDGSFDYLRLSGTSMSAAVTTGVVALMIEAHKDRFKTPLSPHAIKAILEFSAIPLSGYDYLSQGAGSLNAGGAIQLAAALDTSTVDGQWWLASGSRRPPLSGTKPSRGGSGSSGATR